MTRKPTRRAILSVTMAAVLSLGAACAVYKPLRVLAPQSFGLTCVSETICVEDPSTIAQATRLRDAALTFVSQRVGPIQEPPKLLFCKSKACFAKFGNPEVAALYMWGLDRLVINDIGWQDHILRHELIHHWQTEQFGPVQGARLPRWYIEGMAYSLSLDPRDPLPRADIQGWRAQFEAWVAQGGDWRQPPQT